ncbi:MAG: Cell envelope-related transcriptional attenuator [Candidatus Roizmanbacteria bacterium GW2011_GWA2_37_7]|uniref:Cell envelope-related transcriptional attenuator n=1 Tax=Candidatus Roizmanbacteria bacterium GW2011_GWA2_37_7 TaxID=1618481 RepID=A0A0G0H7X1_9BACT|nr:MAG: Cell envelope-related transcriptional attenuator [Candidatus Roizmanbacteria bacterium GW2011_GWA2_37_7]
MAKTRLIRIEQRKKLLNYSLISLGLVLIISFCMIVFRILGFYYSIHTEAQETNSSKEKKQEDQKKYTFLLLGYGGGAHEGTYLTDTIMVFHINIKEKRAILISLPRDIWVRVPTKNDPFHSKINAVYQMGMFPKKYPDIDTSLLTEENPSGLLKAVVSDIIGLKVDAFAAVDFQGFIKTIDTLEGIDIEVKKTFTDFEYPIEGEEDNLCERDEEFMKIEPIINKEIADEDAQKLYEQNPGLEQFVKDIKDHPQIAFPCRFEELHFNAGPTLMDGETALKYARSRHATEDGGDFNRALRQQNVLEAVKKKVLAIEFIPKIIPLLDDLEKHIITDLPLSDLNKLLLEARNSNQYSMDTLVLTDEFLTDGYSSYGGYIVYPKEGIDKWGKIQKTIQNMQQGITPSPAGEETAAPLKD